MSENGEYTYTNNPGQVIQPAPEHRQTTTFVEGVTRSGGYVNNEYASAPVSPAPDLSEALAKRAAEERQAIAQEAAQFKAEINSGVTTAQPVQPVAPQAAPQVAPQAVQTSAVQAGPQIPQHVQPAAPQTAPQAAPQAAQAPAAQAGTQIPQHVQPVAPQAAPQAAPQVVTQSVQPQVVQQTVRPQVQQTQVVRTAPQVANYSEYSPQAEQAAPQAPKTEAAAPSESRPDPLPAQGAGGGNQPPKDNGKKKEKKGPNVGIRILIAAACGLVFGLVAGGVILLMTRVIPGNNVANNNPSQGVITSENVVVDKPSEQPDSSEISSAGALIGDGQEETITVTDVTADMTVPEVAEECMPSIVIINTLVDYNYYGYVQEVPASGTGVIVGMNEDDLFIATNYHVVQDAKEISVQFCDSSTANAEVKGKKVSTDLAVITVDLSALGQQTKDSIKLARVGSSDNLVVGESCVAIGNALGYGQSVTAGVISALNREVTTETGETGTFIQTDAAINPGNSGGALLNMKGELIGINSNKRSATQVEGMGYAIPIDIARPIIEQLIAKKELTELPAEEQSYFGISGATVQSGATTSNGMSIPAGIYVSSVVAGSPADKAGIQRGDIITEFDGESVISIAELMQCLASYPSGATVPVTYKRLENGAFVTYETQVTLEAKANVSTN